MDTYKTTQAISRLREIDDKIKTLKIEQKEFTNVLIGEILGSKDLRQCLKDGIIKLNFPAFPGFYSELRNSEY